MKKKLRAQIKSRWYYIFWGVAIIAVVAGQINIGSGYRQMSNSIESLNKCINWKRGGF